MNWTRDKMDTFKSPQDVANDISIQIHGMFQQQTAEADGFAFNGYILPQGDIYVFCTTSKDLAEAIVELAHAQYSAQEIPLSGKPN